MSVTERRNGFTAQLEQSRLAQRWRTLASREQFALATLLLFVVSVMFYLMLWLPAGQHMRSARSDFEAQRELNAYLNSYAPAARNLDGVVRVSVEPSRLQGLVTTTAAAHGLTIERLDNSAVGLLQVNLQPAPLVLLLRWFSVLREQGVEIAEAGLDRSDDKVSSRLTLRVNQ